MAPEDWRRSFQLWFYDKRHVFVLKKKDCIYRYVSEKKNKPQHNYFQQFFTTKIRRHCFADDPY